MKKKSLKVLLAGLLMGIGAFALSGCQTTDYSAVVPTQECKVTIMQDQGTGNKYAEVVLGIANPTIYNVTEISVTWAAYEEDSDTPITAPSTDAIGVYVSHGVGGYVAYRLNIDPHGPYKDAASVKISKAEATKYMSLFDTYMAPFIISFVLVGFSLIFFAFEIFRGGLTAEYLRTRMKEKLASYLTILALTILICLIPLMFSSWVTTVILVCGFAASFLLCGLMALIRMAFIKK